MVAGLPLNAEMFRVGSRGRLLIGHTVQQDLFMYAGVHKWYFYCLRGVSRATVHHIVGEFVRLSGGELSDGEANGEYAASIITKCCDDLWEAFCFADLDDPARGLLPTLEDYTLTEMRQYLRAKQNRRFTGAI